MKIQSIINPINPLLATILPWIFCYIYLAPSDLVSDVSKEKVGVIAPIIFLIVSLLQTYTQSYRTKIMINKWIEENSANTEFNNFLNNYLYEINKITTSVFYFTLGWGLFTSCLGFVYENKHFDYSDLFMIYFSIFAYIFFFYGTGMVNNILTKPKCRTTKEKASLILCLTMIGPFFVAFLIYMCKYSGNIVVASMMVFLFFIQINTLPSILLLKYSSDMDEAGLIQQA